MEDSKEQGQEGHISDNEEEMICIVQPEEATQIHAQPQVLKSTASNENTAVDDHVDRPNFEHEHKQPRPAYKRVELCIADKLRVIAAGSTGMSQRQVAKQFGISKTQVQTLLKRKDEIMRRYDEGYEKWRKRTKFSKNDFEDVNEHVWKWYMERVGCSNETITIPILKAKAIEISQELGLGDEFKASNGWLEYFKKRYNIQLGRKNKAEKSLESVDTITMVDIHQRQNSNTEPTLPRRDYEGTLNPPKTESLSRKNDLKIHNVFSMQGQHPIVHQVRPVPLQVPQIPMYRQCPASMVTQQHASTPSMVFAANSPQLSVENNGHESTARLQVKTFNEALKCAAALKAFAVDRGSVTLIGLMTAMEHELQRETRSGPSLQHDVHDFDENSTILMK